LACTNCETKDEAPLVKQKRKNEGKEIRGGGVMRFQPRRGKRGNLQKEKVPRRPRKRGRRSPRDATKNDGGEKNRVQSCTWEPERSRKGRRLRSSKEKKVRAADFPLPFEIPSPEERVRKKSARSWWADQIS